MLRNADHLIPIWLASILVCPDCRGDLDSENQTVRCCRCQTPFVQHEPHVVELCSKDDRYGRPGWRDRQHEMTSAYDELVVDREHSILAYNSDYNPLASRLEPFTGRVMDLGGGNGIVRHWLPHVTEYVTLDPSTAWLAQPWHTLAAVFPCLGCRPPFVRGLGERLPFADGAFDGGLSIWSLNHASEPGTVMQEAARVLRPGGRLLLVLDDVPPSWRDVVVGQRPEQPPAERLLIGLRKMAWTVTGVPLQSDHLRISEAEIAGWSRPTLTRVGRTWVGDYLVDEFEKQ